MQLFALIKQDKIMVDSVLNYAVVCWMHQRFIFEVHQINHPRMYHAVVALWHI